MSCGKPLPTDGGRSSRSLGSNRNELRRPVRQGGPGKSTRGQRASSHESAAPVEHYAPRNKIVVPLNASGRTEAVRTRPYGVNRREGSISFTEERH